MVVSLTVVMVIGSGGQTSAGSTSVVATPVRAAFYYPWFPETEHWATHYGPLLGKYDSSSPTILARHVSMARYAGLDAFISSWWGSGSRTAQRLPLLLAAARPQGFHVAPYYELESRPTPPAVAELTADFATLAAMKDDPAWLVVSGKPVLFVYNTGTEASCAAITRLEEVNAGRFYLNAKVFRGYLACPTQPESWHQYGPAVAYDQQTTYSASVSPGFFKFNESTPRLRRDLTAFRAALARQVASKARWQLVTTFNEWGEGSSVEPASEWPSASGQGSYLDELRSAYWGTPVPTSNTTTTAPTTTATRPTSTATTSPTTSPTTGVPANAVSKIIVFVEENHSLSEMRDGMPYLYGEATTFGYTINYKAATHPSLPNYLAFAGGSTFGVTNDGNPSVHPVTGPSVFGQALSVGKTAKSYQESMPSNCFATNSGKYAPKHNPWAYFTQERNLCNSLDVPAGTLAAGALRSDVVGGSLPNLSEVTPNLSNDAHDGSLADADAWLKGWLELIYSSPDWKAGRLAVLVSADEDDSTADNTVLTVVIHSSQSHDVVTTPLNHYSLNRLLTEVSGAGCIAAGCSAPDLAAAFGLPLASG